MKNNFYSFFKYFINYRKNGFIYNINKKITIEEEIQELEKYINNEEAIIEGNNKKIEEEESKIIGHKTKRPTDEHRDDNSSELEAYEGKNKKKKYHILRYILTK